MTDKATMKKLVETQLKYYNERNIELFCACFHPEIEITNLGSEEKEIGIELFRSNFKSFFESSPNLHCEIKSRVFLTKAIIDEESISGASSRPEGIHAVAIYRFRDDLISNICFVR